MAFDLKILAANLRAERARKGVSRELVGAAIKASPASVQKWESGETVPGSDALFSLANFYGKSMDELSGRATAA